MAITASKRKFMNHCKGLIMGPVDHLPTFVEFYNTLPGTNEEISQGTFTEMLNHIENMPDFDMILDPEVDKFAQLYINMAIGQEGPRVTPNEYSDGSEVPDPSTFEQPKTEAEPEAGPKTKKAKAQAEAKAKAQAEAKKAKKAKKAKTEQAEPKTRKSSKAYYNWVNRFASRVGIMDEAIIEALRGNDVKEYYEGKQHCYVVLACRCKLLDMYRQTGDETLKAYALARSNKKTLESLKKVNYFNIADLVD